MIFGEIHRSTAFFYGVKGFRGNDIYHRNVADGGIIGKFVCAEMNDDDQIERSIPKRKKRRYIRIFFGIRRVVDAAVRIWNAVYYNGVKDVGIAAEASVHATACS